MEESKSIDSAGGRRGETRHEDLFERKTAGRCMQTSLPRAFEADRVTTGARRVAPRSRGTIVLCPGAGYAELTNSSNSGRTVAHEGTRRHAW